MCGIYACFHNGKQPSYRHSRIKPRGPDETIVIDGGSRCLAFYRLKIVGVSDGAQPFISDDIELMCNGEIYNYKELADQYNIELKTHSDCEIIMHLYRQLGIEQTVQLLYGEFAFILIDKAKKLVHFARDRFGVKPLYMSTVTCMGKIQSLELSSLVRACIHSEMLTHVDPRQVYTYDIAHGSMSSQAYCLIQYKSMQCNPEPPHIYNRLVQAVKVRVQQTERKIGFLLSGGLDSSIILSIALTECKMPELVDVFTFAFEENAPDVQAARLMVKYLKEKHGENCINWHLVVQPIQTGLDVIGDVLQLLETYDTTTVRASVPMYLISKYIAEKTDVKVLISGEGADELFGGYLYMLYAPNDSAFRAEIIKLLSELYMYDCLRADRTTAANGLEVRPPFLDQYLVDIVLNSSKLTCNREITKSLLRQIARDANLLPPAILVGKKEAFSDAVGLSWQESLEDYAANAIDSFCEKFGQNFAREGHFSTTVSPVSSTARLFQIMFRNSFGTQWKLLPKLWLPNQNWVDTGGEPSARILSCYNKLPVFTTD